MKYVLVFVSVCVLAESQLVPAGVAACVSDKMFFKVTNKDKICK